MKAVVGFAFVACFADAVVGPAGQDRNASAVPQVPLSADLYQAAVRELQQSCGHVCVTGLDNFNKDYAGHGLDAALVAFGNHISQFLDEAKADYGQGNITGAFLVRSGAKTLGGHRSNLGLADLLSDVACSSTTACKLKSFLANVCNYGRVALQTVYQVVNVVVHIMAVLITLLCGCLHILTVSFCVLQGIPPICIFPYNVYSKINTASTQIWEAVKATTQFCMLHGGL
ncbi:unnamed protein product [Effrenium voratum]|uniref:Secreted protein n=1 Tax=Effrenium voratum TaxID=2562239 RepID=A0AA36HLH7_9DINO|nr:unnamed protein product [Effrenium voratum]